METPTSHNPADAPKNISYLLEQYQQRYGRLLESLRLWEVQVATLLNLLAASSSKRTDGGFTIRAETEAAERTCAEIDKLRRALQQIPTPELKAK